MTRVAVRSPSTLLPTAPLPRLPASSRVPTLTVTRPLKLLKVLVSFHQPAPYMSLLPALGLTVRLSTLVLWSMMPLRVLPTVWPCSMRVLLPVLVMLMSPLSTRGLMPLPAMRTVFAPPFREKLRLLASPAPTYSKRASWVLPGRPRMIAEPVPIGLTAPMSGRLLTRTVVTWVVLPMTGLLVSSFWPNRPKNEALPTAL